MNEFKRIIIQRNEKLIFDDISNPFDIIIHLQSKNVLSLYEESLIKSSGNQTATLIEILLQKTDGPWFEEFLIALDNDYNWISKQIKDEFEVHEEEKRTFYLRNVPPLPQHNVKRKVHVENLCKEIKSLKRNNYLVVHGMAGSGKTCLVVDSLQDVNLLEKSTNGCVYWMSVGDLRSEELDELQCNELRKKLCDMVNLTTNPQQDLLIQLKTHFSLKPNSSALLVLDKVRSSKVVEALNVGCKILVTTQDYDLVKDQKKKLYSVNDGFSESESVKLLQDFILDDAGSLIPSIKERALRIHRAWKGHPMIIGLIGGELSENKEESRKHPSRWKAYERPSVSEDSNTRRRSVVEEQMSAIIQLTTEKLQLKQKKLFEMLAVFVGDTNITTDVLCILWEMDKDEVEEVIVHFYKRSLVFRKYSPNLQKFVYGIHDILMEHLKKNISDQDLQDMHYDFICKYFTVCDGDFSKLPQDNYIYSYLCHHIECAKKWDEFRDQFFSLRYIESKLKATGPGDLLLDLNKYHDGLGNSSDYQTKVEDIKRFVKTSGWDISRNEVDIVQCALLQAPKSFLYEQGAAIAVQSNGQKIYLSPLHSWEKPKDLEMEVSNVHAVSIVKNTSINHARVLICPGDEECNVVEIDLHYRQRRRSFNQNSQVTRVKMSPLCDKFLSALSNGCVNVWNLNSENESNADTPPPSLKQKSYLAHFVETRTVPSLTLPHSRQVISASFSSDGRLLVAASEDGYVNIWNIEENILKQRFELHPNPSAIACTFICDDKMIAYGCANRVLFIQDLKCREKESIELDKNCDGLVDLLCVTDYARTLIVVHEKAVKLLWWENETLKHTKSGPRTFELVGLSIRELHRESTKIYTATYHQGHRLLLGTSNGCLLINNVFDNPYQQRYGSGVIKAVDMVDNRILFAQKDLVKLCIPELKESSGIQPISTHLGWSSRDVSVFTTASTSGAIQVHHDGKLVAETFRQQSCIVRVSAHGNFVLIGTADGNILLLDTISKNTVLQSHLGCPITYLNAAMCNLSPVYIAAAEQNSGQYILQVIKDGHNARHGINAAVVETFVCSQHNSALVVLSDYSIMVWKFNKGVQEHVVFIQEGRPSAKITNAYLSQKEDVLVLSDQENCYHLFRLQWPRTENSNLRNESVNLSLRTPLGLNNSIANQMPHPIGDGIDEVDGVRMSVACLPKVKNMITHKLQAPSWCCCVCAKETLVAVGHDDCKVVIWNLKRQVEFESFSILPNRRTKVCQVQFSPYGVTYGSFRHELILFAVTDCLSLWDVSPFLNDNAVVNRVPECLGCISGGSGAIQQLSISPSCTKFAASDVSGRFFLWKVWDSE